MEIREVKEHLKRRIGRYEEEIEEIEGIESEEWRKSQKERNSELRARDDECIEILRWITRKEGSRNDKNKMRQRRIRGENK